MTEKHNLPERVARAEARMDGHEDLCSERYETIKSKIDLLSEKIDNSFKDNRDSDRAIIEWKAMLRGFFALVGFLSSAVGITYALNILMK